MREIETKTGKLTGIEEDGCNVYKGIPYAEPPVGENRWKPPVPKKPWDRVLSCDKFQKIAPQRLPDGTHPWDKLYYKEFYAYSEYAREQSEDCLYLNIYTPKDAVGKKLPVAFWIHGGGFSMGYSSEIEFGGSAYAAKDVILVTIDYRLGILGFLAHPWLTAESERGISGNYGILDQIEALRWVQENIAAFGGDPENITVFGQSAGCMSTEVLVSSDLTGGMIAKAILQSGTVCADDFLYTPTLAEEEEVGKLFVATSGAKSLAELRALPIEKVLAAQDEVGVKTMDLGNGLMIVPNADGYVLKKTVKETWKAGEMKAIPYLTGSNADDLTATEEDIAAKRPGLLQAECVKWAERVEEACGKETYIYFFSHSLPGDGVTGFHSAELWYMLGTYPRWWRPQTTEDAALSEEMVEAWTRFMKTGKPGGDWAPHTKSAPFIKQFA